MKVNEYPTNKDYCHKYAYYLTKAIPPTNLDLFYTKLD